MTFIYRNVANINFNIKVKDIRREVKKFIFRFIEKDI